MRGEWEGFREALQYGRRHGKGLKGLMLILRKVIKENTQERNDFKGTRENKERKWRTKSDTLRSGNQTISQTGEQLF